jgi:hypothetical protein
MCDLHVDYFLFFWANIPYWTNDASMLNGFIYDCNIDPHDTISPFVHESPIGIIVNGVPYFRFS